jgi:hypothetical protein
MTEDIQGIEEVQMQETPVEKTLLQSEVNAIVGRAKADAADKARRQAEVEFQQKLQELEAQKAMQEQRGEDTTDVNVDLVYQQVQERMQQEMQQKQLEDHMRQVADSYESKMATGKESYEDFDDVVKEFNPADFPQIVYLVHGIDNAADIVYELSKNPQKLATIDYLSQRSPDTARRELQKMGQSIATNRQALAEEVQTSSPLDRIQPTNRTGNNGQLSVSDLRNQPWLRG